MAPTNQHIHHPHNETSFKFKSSGGTKSPMDLPWDPDETALPPRGHLPVIPDALEEAAWVWGKDDALGRFNLLTPKRIREAAKEIRTGEMVSLNLPFHLPNPPAVGRRSFFHEIIPAPDFTSFDDHWTCNTQSGSQWDGFRHFCHLPSGLHYNGLKRSDIFGPEANNRISIADLAKHGVATRGVLLDYWHYAAVTNNTYNVLSDHAITYSDLAACAKFQGLDIRPASEGGDMRPGDLLLLRLGWTETYLNLPQEHWSHQTSLPHVTNSEDGAPTAKYAGIDQGEDMKTWLHDSYFCAVASDSPTVERWPSPTGRYLHEWLLALWGMGIGEIWDLEELAAKCRANSRWTFFITSAPANVLGGIASPPNALAFL